MIIGIHAAAAFKKERTGVEEYAFRLIRYFAMLEEGKKHRFLLYTPFSPEESDLPRNFEIKTLRFPVFWTQVRLALEMALNKPGALFIPAHVLPLIHPKNSVVTIHDLAFEYFPEMYPLFHRRYLRWTTKYAISKAKKIIVPSENTKSDLIKFYNAPQDKIKVIYHGAEFFIVPDETQPILSEKYILYVGRIEKKKNIQGLIRSFELAKEKYQIPHKLVLAGGQGYLFEEIMKKIDNSPFKQDIILTGHLQEKQKNVFLKFADLFVFPSFYEGFGFPILEAQAAEVPVIASNVSSLPEVARERALFFDPADFEQMAEVIYSAASRTELRESLIKKGSENLRRF